MLRYLAPAKVGLLALVELYVEGAVSNDATIPVVEFLASHLLDFSLINRPQYPEHQWQHANALIRINVSVHHFEKLLSSFAAADRLPGRRLWDRFLEKLWGIDSLHALHEFFERSSVLVAKSRAEFRRLAEDKEQHHTGILLAPNSPLGAFVRKASLEFSKLQFEQSLELWKAFVDYRQPTAAYWKFRNSRFSRHSFDSVLLASEREWGPQTLELAAAAYGSIQRGDLRDGALLVSTDDIENLIEYQIAHGQKSGDRVPREIKKRYQDLMTKSRVIPSLSHYLNFSDSWRSGEFPTSFEYLHRYFDYTIQNRDRLFYQYALLSLAIVQSDFGCNREAVATMLEAVSAAREDRDTACLNFALNWLYHFSKTHPELSKELEDSNMLGTAKESLAYLRTKAKETGMWVLWSSALLSEAKLCLSNGESISNALENMARSSHVIIERNMKPMMGAQISLTTTLWDRLGLASMSAMMCEVFLRCHATSSLFDDQLRITCRLSGLLSSKGMYEEAFERLESLGSNSLRSAKIRQYWRLYHGVLNLRRVLHQNRLDAASALVSQLLQVSPEETDPAIISIIHMMHIETLTRCCDFDQALGKVERLLSEFRQSNKDISLRLRLLLAKAHLFDCIGRPEKGFTIAIRAASIAWRARLTSLLWQAIGAIANILNALGEFMASEKLLIAILPRCLETETTFIAGTLYNILADARLGRTREINLSRTAVDHAMKYLMVHDALDSAYKCFSVVEDVVKQDEILAKKATVSRLSLITH